MMNMAQKEECCKICRQRLKMRESSESILLVCINSRCSNFWMNEGSEIIMMLK